MKSSLPIKLCLILVFVSLLGCGSGSTNVGSQTGSVTAQLQWLERTSSSARSTGKQIATAPQGVVTVVIVVSGTGMSNIQQDFPASAGTAVIGGVPVGSNLSLTAQGLDASGVVTNQGVISNITVLAGQTTDAGTVVMDPAGQTYTLSGTITVNGSPLPGVTVSLQGTSFSTVTGSDGTYSLTVPNATYTVVPSLAGYTFTSATLTVPDSNGNVTGQNFTAIPIPVQTYTISGSVTLNGNGLPGVTVSLQGTLFSTVTASDGTYSLTGVPNGPYTIIPSLTGYAFTPATLSVSVNNANVTGQNFTATVLSYTISGTITLNGSGLPGVTVSLQGTSSNSVTTASDGTYSFTGVQNGLYTVTPSLAGYTFTPANLSVSVNNGNVTGQDFTAAPSIVNIAGAWSIFHTPQGGAEQGPNFATFSQTGNAVTLNYYTDDGIMKTGSGTISGNNIQLSFGNTDSCNNAATVTITGTISADGTTITGTYTQTGTSGNCSGGETGTWSAIEAQPPAFNISGNWSVSNTPQGGTAGAPSCATIAQSGSFITGSLPNANILGILSGTSIQLLEVGIPSSCLELTSVTGTIASDGNSASGTYNTTYKPSGCNTPVSGTWSATEGPCTPVTLNSISVSPANPSIAIGATQQFTATGTYSDGSTQDITTQVTWSSSNTSFATVSSSGLASGIAAGNTTITAALGGVTGSTVLTVTLLPNGFPSNVPAGNYNIAVQICAQENCFSAESFTEANTNISQFAQGLVAALNADVAQQAPGCSQAGNSCSFNIVYTPWNGSSFTITDTITITTPTGSASVSIIFTVTLIT